MELCMKIFLRCFFFCSLFLCVSCTTTQRFLLDGRGAGEVRKNIGRIEGSQQSIEEATSLIENYSSNIEEIIDREGELIEEFRRLLRLIRCFSIILSFIVIFYVGIKLFCLFKIKKI